MKKGVQNEAQNTSVTLFYATLRNDCAELIHILVTQSVNGRLNLFEVYFCA